MNHTPKKNKKGKTLSVIFLVVSCVGLVVSSLLEISYRVFYQIIALLFSAVSFELLDRYYLSTYCYEVTEESFIIRKSNGKKIRTLCNLDLSTLLGIEKKPKTKEQKAALVSRYGKHRLSYHYTQSLAPQDPYLIFFEFNGKTAEIAFEPSLEMVAYINALIQKRNETEKTFFE